MRDFLDDNFLLNNETAIRLYHDVAKNIPIYDYHCYLDPKRLVNDDSFENLGELMMRFDHYKWRAMTSYGIKEDYIRGEADYYQKFKAYAEILPYLVGNPLYHWTHLELRRIFGIYDLLSKDTANSIWDKANEVLKNEGLTARKLLNKMNVRLTCISTDMCDDLSDFKQLRGINDFNVKVVPTLRCDSLLDIQWPGFAEYMKNLEGITGVRVHSFDDLVDLISRRIDTFHENGARMASLDLEAVPYIDYSHKRVDRALRDAMSGIMPGSKDTLHYKTALLFELAKCFKKKKWAQQYHISAIRDCNSQLLAKFGIKSGSDAIDDSHMARQLVGLLDLQLKEDALPKTILFTMNPQDNEVLASIAGAFQGGLKGKMQFGTAWWFGDTRAGFERHLQKLASVGVLSTFIGMVTDSRSILSYSRHEYFRRILCNLLGTWVESGEFINDFNVLSEIVSGICFNNANEYFGIDLN